MKNQKKQFFLLVVLLIILVAGYFGLQKYKEYEANLPVEDTTQWVINLAGEEVTELSYTYSGVSYAFVKEEDVWKSVEDATLSIKQATIENMATQITQIEAVQNIENVEDMSAYGLDEPTRTMTFTIAGVSSTVKVGNYNSISYVYYISVDDGTTVYAVESDLISAFNYSLEDVTEESEEEETEEADETEAEGADEAEVEEAETEETDEAEVEEAVTEEKTME